MTNNRNFEEFLDEFIPNTMNLIKDFDGNSYNAIIGEINSYEGNDDDEFIRRISSNRQLRIKDGVLLSTLFYVQRKYIYNIKDRNIYANENMLLRLNLGFIYLLEKGLSLAYCKRLTVKKTKVKNLFESDQFIQTSFEIFLFGLISSVPNVTNIDCPSIEANKKTPDIVFDIFEHNYAIEAIATREVRTMSIYEYVRDFGREISDILTSKFRGNYETDIFVYRDVSITSLRVDFEEVRNYIENNSNQVRDDIANNGKFRLKFPQRIPRYLIVITESISDKNESFYIQQLDAEKERVEYIICDRYWDKFRLGQLSSYTNSYITVLIYREPNSYDSQEIKRKISYMIQPSSKCMPDLIAITYSPSKAENPFHAGVIKLSSNNNRQFETEFISRLISQNSEFKRWLSLISA